MTSTVAIKKSKVTWHRKLEMPFMILIAFILAIGFAGLTIPIYVDFMYKNYYSEKVENHIYHKVQPQCLVPKG